MLRHNVIPVLSLLAIYLTAGQGIEVTLTRLSTLYLPTYGEGGSVSYPMPSVSIEQLAFEPKGKVIYGVGKDIIHIIGASDAMNLASVDYVIVPNLELTDVEVCDDAVFISYRNDSNRQRGGVLVYQRYDPLTKQMELLHDIPMGSLPDMVYPTKDCTLVVAIENEGFIENGQFYDPPGGVGIVRFPSGIQAKPEVKMLNFTAFDEQFSQLSEKGVRWVFRGNNNNFSDNIEPEYIAFNADYSTAYIALQENNAIAVVDMATDNITAIHGLGFKKWGELDPSDRDGGINMKTWPVYGMYQPDSILCVRWNDQDYIITANEGDAQEYGAPVNFAEETRGKNIDRANISSNVSNDLKEALQDDAKLGRLTISSVDGKNAEGKFERFYTYGARSFSIWRASDMERVYDSGSELEQKVATFRPDIFNSNTVDTRYLNETVDTRSDNKGPETESLAAGELDDHLLIFVGNERGSSIAVYSVAKGGLKPTFQTLFTGIPRDNARTWKDIFDARELFAIDPEFMR
ncbi:mesenchyme-specific cell surface glycoprotein-like isoform X2 [Littorina saxatilis]